MVLALCQTDTQASQVRLRASKAGNGHTPDTLPAASASITAT
jgi:hypothetical protein